MLIQNMRQIDGLALYNIQELYLQESLELEQILWQEYGYENRQQSTEWIQLGNGGRLKKRLPTCEEQF
jgi:hypothetical protein